MQVSKICTLIWVYPKQWWLDLNIPATIRLYLNDFRLSIPPSSIPPHYEFIILFNVSPTSVKSQYRKQSHIGIRIFIQII